MKKLYKFLVGSSLAILFATTILLFIFSIQNNNPVPKVIGREVPLYWAKIEKNKDSYDFSETERMLEVVKAENAKATLVLGFKPGKNGCSFPDWYDKNASQIEKDKHLFQFIRSAVAEFRDNSTVAAWKIDYMPLFIKEGCPAPDKNLLEVEQELVRQLDKENKRTVLVNKNQEITWSNFINWLYNR